MEQKLVEKHMKINNMDEKYEGLSWYLPSHFKDSLAKCRFEQGTIIYKDKLIGSSWGEQKKGIDFLIQVKHPPSIMTSIGGDESIMKTNWDSEVIFDRIYPNSGEKEEIKTSQGRLFTFLWKNDFEVFKNSEPILPPLFKVSNSQINADFVKSITPDNSISFSFIYNPINDLLITKLKSIKEKGSLICKIEEQTYSIEEACVLENINSLTETYPLISVKVLIFYDLTADVLHDIIKDIVYKGKMNQFSLKSHGLLIQK